MDEDNTTKVTVAELAEMLQKVKDNYAPHCTVKSLHFDKSAAGNVVVLKVDTGHGCEHDEWMNKK